MTRETIPTMYIFTCDATGYKQESSSAKVPADWLAVTMTINNEKGDRVTEHIKHFCPSATHNATSAVLNAIHGLKKDD